MNGRTWIVALGSAAFVGGCGDGLMGTDPQQALRAGAVIGENVVVSGAGLGTQPATLEITIPVSVPADILSARMRWVGRSLTATGDPNLLVNGHQRTATLLASYEVGGDFPWVFFYEIDAAPLLRPGANRLFVGGFDLPGTSREDGVGLIVRYRDPASPWSAITTLDPHEFVTSGAGAVWEYPIGASTEPRNARLVLFTGDATATAPDRLWLDIGPGPTPTDLVGSASSVMNDVLVSALGNRMDLLTQDLVIPARASHFAYQFESPADVGDSIVHFLSALCTDGDASFCTGEIGGRVWQDADRDGMDGGEPGFEGVNVMLRDGTDAVVATASTDADGAFLFDILCAGDYIVEVDESTLPEGLEQTSCTEGDCSPFAVSLAGDVEVVSDLAFGYAEPVPPAPTEGCFHRLGFWQSAFHRHHRDRCHHDPRIDDETLLSLLPIVQATTSVDWTRGDGHLDFQDVSYGLRGYGPWHGHNRRTCAAAKRQYLACLLNYAYNGAPTDLPVDTDRDGVTDMTWGQMISDAESLLSEGDKGACLAVLRMSFSVNAMESHGCP